jgi:hypothetical protein
VEERDRVAESAQRIARAIAGRELAVLRAFLAPGFVHRTPGGDTVDAEAFLRGIELIPGDITFVRLERVEIDMSDTGALVTGIQHAQVRVDGTLLDDRRPFVDWFVKDAGTWLIRAAVSLPEETPK